MAKKVTNNDISNLEIQKQNQNDLRALEEAYINDEIAKMPQYIEKQKEKITQELIEFAGSHTVEIFDRWNNAVGKEIRVNPLVISNYFFKPIVSITAAIPEYNAEKLGLVFDYYLYILAEINDKLGNYPSSLSNFCKLAGITLQTLRNYRNSPDPYMRNVVEKIYDQVSDENITMSQMGIVKERSTIFRLKSQNEVTEAVTPSVNINYTEVVDKTAVNDRINKYKKFIDNKKVN